MQPFGQQGTPLTPVPTADHHAQLPATNGKVQNARQPAAEDGVWPQWGEIRHAGPTKRVYLDVFGGHKGQKKESQDSGRNATPNQPGY